MYLVLTKYTIEADVQQLLLEAQSKFNCTIKQNPRKIVAEEIVSKLDFKKFIVFSDKFSLHLQTNIFNNIANLYVKTVVLLAMQNK